MEQHEPDAGPEPDVADLDAPLRRELDAFYRDPELDERIRDALDAAYDVGLRPLA